MSAVVEVWVSELGKLKEKVGAKKRFLWSSKKVKHAEGGDEGEVDQQQQPAVAAAAHEGAVMETTVRKERRNSSTLSEATVCMLMDRFVPW
ncbi:hypothetical protein ABKV19_000469 [Rosa sericea]|uniref:Uncharacterized protein n=1 Tax=Rosa chinensis TaxID=74649 RepID=A0A2P6PN97_ROSCH|nr:uncharacterized protein LOC112169844 [Rosa chinensis]PRQ23391.1 hypothetical protein RchiOBHm_Chr6g0260831 [Rosa chinensis]